MSKPGKVCTFTTDLSEAGPKDADVVFIGVGTPAAEDGSADLQYVMAAAKELARLLEGFTVIAIKSTVPVGTGDKVEALMRRSRAGGRFRRRVQSRISARRRSYC